MILIIDNYDSFVYNLAQYIGELGGEPLVKRNDDVELSDIARLKPSHIIISPGPCTPTQAGVSNSVVEYFGGEIPILGVCLGHQCIGEVYEGQVVHSPQPLHGKSSIIKHDGLRIYRGIPNPLQGGRYHSLIVELGSDSSLIVTARSEDGLIMGIRHPQFTVEGIQFHPESIMTPCGHALLRNFLGYSGGKWAAGPQP
jgi:anthranilate synthase/aminodeoxychorismate synthase-like glutamine amidotransferase